MTTPWHMTRAASRRELPKPRKMHGPVGSSVNIDWGGGIVDFAHRCCGCHFCSCKPVERLTPGKLMRRECATCNNTCERGWNYCNECIERKIMRGRDEVYDK